MENKELDNKLEEILNRISAFESKIRKIEDKEIDDMISTIDRCMSKILRHGCDRYVVSTLEYNMKRYNVELDQVKYQLLEDSDKNCEIEYIYCGDSISIQDGISLINGEIYKFSYENCLNANLYSDMIKILDKKIIIKHNNYDMYPISVQIKDTKHSIYHQYEGTNFTWNRNSKNGILTLLELGLFKLKEF